MARNLLTYDPSRAFVVHASAVKVNGSAWVFLGPSGAGKSTICRLLSPCAEPLADDWVYFVSLDGGDGYGVTSADVAKTKSFRSWDMSDLRSIPLAAIFILNQNETLLIEHMDVVEYCYHLLISFYGLPINSRMMIEVRKIIFSRIVKISESVPGYRLYFPLSSDIFAALRAKVLESIS